MIFTIVLCEFYYKLYFSTPAILRTVYLSLLKYQQTKETTVREICEQMYLILISEQELVP